MNELALEMGVEGMAFHRTEMEKHFGVEGMSADAARYWAIPRASDHKR